jgi:hypothetical protein
LKVPTFQKYGLTKAGVEKSELRDKKISDILTHHLTIGIGIVFGILIYILNYSKVRPSTFIQVVMQVFLFASMGVLCVGIPAVLFKFAEMFYFKYFRSKTEEKQNIQKYYEEKEEFDFWKIRKDYSFWKVLDGLSFEREIMNVYSYLDYSINDDSMSIEKANDKILTKENKNIYISFETGKEISDTGKIDRIIELKKLNKCEDAIIFTQQGVIKKALDYAKEKNVQVNDINAIIKVVKTVPVN